MDKQGKVKCYEIGAILIDKDGSECIVTGRTPTSYRININKKSTKGIDSDDWHTEDEVFKRFNVKP